MMAVWFWDAIDVAWKTLKEFRRKVVGADAMHHATLKPAYTDKLLFNTLALKFPALFTPTQNGIKVASRIDKEFLPEEKIAMLAEVEAEDKAKNPTPDVEEAHFSGARGGRRPQFEQDRRTIINEHSTSLDIDNKLAYLYNYYVEHGKTYEMLRRTFCEDCKH
ncbi:hypothetical protein E4U57_001204 [Claviceps arundinis]|uniref:Uncharacterized protein n=1 Tax=Claviceps arundinis TaxID=1623583 RepID=A0ABQ7PB64_9HYPO|nr:hypothetical protein E4U57_001204 [Claviceps arundinis]